MPNDDYIKRSDAKKILSLLPADLDAETMQRCIEAMSRVPAADVEQVRHGRFIIHLFNEWMCSECGQFYEGDKPTYPYCANCGAKMEEDYDGK